MNSFTIKCNNCGNEVVATNENLSDYLANYAWGKKDILKDDIQDKILIACVEDFMEAILCSCGNKICKF